MTRKKGSGSRWLAGLLAFLLAQSAWVPGSVALPPSAAPQRSIPIAAAAAAPGTRAPAPARLPVLPAAAVPGPRPVPITDAPATFPPPERPPVKLRRPDAPAWSGTVSLSAETGRLAPGQQVALKVNGKPIAGRPGNPAAFQLDTRQFPDGPYDIAADVEAEGRPLASDQQRVIFDNTPPDFVRVEQAQVMPEGVPVPVTAHLSDLGAGVDRVLLHRDGQAIPMERRADGLYQATLSGLMQGSRYRLEAIDRAGNRAFWPEQGQAEALVAPRAVSAEQPGVMATEFTATTTDSLQPETLTIAATSTATSGTIATNTTWTAAGSPYLVTATVTVNAGVTLTVEPGVIVKFATGTYLRVSGTLFAEGLPNSPIIFTSAKDDANGGDTTGDETATVPAAGDWYNIEVRAGGTATVANASLLYGGRSCPTLCGNGGTIAADGITVQNSLTRGVQIADGYVRNSSFAANASGGVTVTGGTPAVSNNLISGGSHGIYVSGGTPTITQNTITGSTTAGLYFYGYTGDVAATLTGNTVTDTKGYAADISLSAKAIGALQASDNRFSGNLYNGYGLGGSFGGTATLPLLDYPYVPHGVSIVSGASLTIPAGAILKAASGSITNNGTLTVGGTAENPVIFTSAKDDTVGGDTNSDGSATVPAAGNWDALILAAGTANIDHATFRYGGASYVQIDHRAGTATLNGLTVSDTRQVGLFLRAGSALTDSTITTPAGYAVHVKAGDPLIRGNRLSGSTGIYVDRSKPAIRENSITGGAYGIYLYNYGTALVFPEITDNQLSGATTAGIYASVSSLTFSGLTLTGNTITNSTYPVRFHLDSAAWGSNTIGNNRFAGNSANGYVLTGKITNSSAFYPLDQPFVFISQFNVDGTATGVFNPGTVFKLTSGGSLVVWDKATLEVRGTAEQPVVFTSVRDDSVGGDTNGDGAASLPAAGDWQDVTFYGKGIVDNAKLLYGGSKTYQQPIVYSSHGNFQLTNTEIGFSGYDGIWAINDGSENSLIANSRIHDAPHYGVGLQQITKLTISNSELYGNGRGLYTIYASPYVEASTLRNNATAIYNMADPATPIPTIRLSNVINNGRAVYNWTRSDPLDLRFNWWGSDNGPAWGAVANGIEGRASAGPWIGRAYEDARQFGSAWWTGYVNAVNMVTGSWTRQVTDLTVEGGKGFGIQIVRTYNSLGWTNESFGQLWTFNYDLGVKEEPDQHRVTLTYGSGQQARFTTNSDGTFTGPPGDRSTLLRTADGGWDLTTKDHSRFRFNAAGRATSATDRNGNATTFSYGADGKLAVITDAGGRQVTLQRDAAGRITRITDPAGNAVTYRYDGAGNLVSQTDLLGETTTYTYDKDHRLLAIVRPDGVTDVRLEYDADTRVKKVYDALGNATTYGYDTAKRSNTVTNPLGQTTKTVYDASFRLLSTTDPLGYTVTTSYDAGNNVISVKDKAGNVTAYTYDSHGNKTTETDADGHVWRFTYDANDNLLTTTDPLGAVTTYAYDAQQNRTIETDPMGRITRFTYDASGQVASETDPLGNVATYTYDAYGYRTAMTDPLGRQTTWTYESRGWLLAETDALGGRKSNAYDDAGRLLTTSDPLGDLTRYAYDATGRQTSQVDAEGRVSRKEYDAAGHTTAEVDPLNGTRRYTYDAAGNVTAAIDELGHVTAFTYDARGAVASVTDPLGNVTRYAYDAGGNRTSVTDPRGNVTRYVYDRNNRLVQVLDHDQVPIETMEFDPVGRMTARTDGEGRTFRWTYYADGQREKVIDPLGNETSYRYDSAGRVGAVSNALGHATTYAYDALGMVTAVTLPDGSLYRYTYDAVGRRTGLVDPNGHAVTVAYDALDRTTATADATGHTTGYTYDKVGNLLTVTDRNGGVTTRTYDGANRLLSVTAPDGLTISYAYDAAGHRISMTDATGTTTYAYDDAGHPTRMTTPDGYSAAFGYDAAGNPSQIADYKGDVTTRSYDSRNRLTAVTAPDGTVTQYSYDKGDLLRRTSYPNGLTADVGYDGAGRLTSLTNRGADGTVFAAYAYTYDVLGRQASVQDEAGLTSYGYDSNSRLTLVTDPDGSATAYSYDGAGNRLSKSVTPAGGTAQTTAYAYDAADRLTQVTNPDGSVSAYRYDANGNLLSDGARTFTYDGLNRLVAAAQNGQTVATYAYNGDGLRVRKDAGGQTTRYYWAGQDVLNEGDGTAITASHLFGVSLIRRETNGQIGYFLFNGHHDVTGVTDPTGAPLADYRYDTWGQPTAQSGSFDNPYRYGAEQYDAETGLIYLRTRHYDPILGRFLSEDTVAGDPLSPQTLNPYAYVANNPLSYNDPSGQWLETLWDLASLGMSIYEFSREPSLLNFGAVVADTAAVILPIVPGGAGAALRAARLANKADHVVDAARAVHAASNLADGVKTARAIEHVSDAAKAVKAVDGARVAARMDDAVDTAKAARTVAADAAEKLDLITYKIRPELTPLKGSRQAGIDRAWALEKELVDKTGRGTRNWSPDEIQELLSKGKVDGYTGHHINWVNGAPDWAGDPRNIRFLSNQPKGGDHLRSLQGHRGSWRNATSGRLIDRAAMIRLSGGAK